MTSPTANTSYTATLVGCGKMGGAMLRSWLDNDLIKSVHIIDPAPLSEELAKDIRTSYSPKFANKPINSDIFILAVKPQILKEAVTDLSKNLSDKTVLISIAAGQSLNTLENIFAKNQPIIRAMPNTPASIGKGMNVAIANKHVNEQQKVMATSFLLSSGEVEWITDEAQMNAVTALSGSGPAYIFYFVEALAKAGENIGLNKDFAMKLARQTVIGSAALLEHENTTPAEQLRRNVTSPGGTTEAALRVFMDDRFQNIVKEALTTAQKRGEELDK